MAQLVSDLKEWFQTDQAQSILRAGLVLLIGLLAAWLVSRRLRRARKLHAQHSMVLRKLLGVVILLVTGLWVLRELGMDLGVLLGAAGILTVALGFASQTSASNVISGVFLMAERPFQVGDLIQMGETIGFVLDVDFLSVKIRTFDNRMIRIPNEAMLKSEVTNLTRFPIRRVDMQIGVAYKEDLDRVRDLLLEVADRDPEALDEPKPLFLFKGYGDSALEFQFSVWATQDNFYALKTRLHLEVKKVFDQHGIEIPFPHRTLYTGSVTEPFPVRLVNEQAPPGAGTS
mgnify:CR=1 FL=1